MNSGVGISALGRELVGEMARLGVVHDLAHLSQKATEEAMEISNSPRLINSHSNSRAVLGDGRERHLEDETVRELARRAGVIGLNLCSAFLAAGRWDEGRATIDDCVRHLDHMAQLVGQTDFLALGSDMDGGFSAARMPDGIDLPRDLEKLSCALRGHGWSEGAVAGFSWGNWERFWGA
jgi:membrane dipeptidase